MSTLHDLVRSGKVRYLGVSGTPAWKVAEANTLSRFRGWPAFVGLQIEYLLLERTVEQELDGQLLLFDRATGENQLWTGKRKAPSRRR